MHSIAAALFLDKRQIHFFGDMGYEHNPYVHCPQGAAYARGKCACDQGRNFGASVPSRPALRAPPCECEG